MTLEFVFKRCTGKSLDELSSTGELDWFDQYADPRRDAGKGVLVANWNHFPCMAASDSHRTAEGKAAQDYNWGKGRAFQTILEKMGYELEWSDQISRCDHCNGAITEGPDYHGDSAHYAILGESDTVCETCIRQEFAEEYLQGLEDKVRSAVNIAGIDPAKYGYEQVQTGFANGFHPGQTDTPAEITKELRKRGVTEPLLFVIDSSGQFDVHFSVWKKVAEQE